MAFSEELKRFLLAQVVSITDFSVPPPTDLAVDANVLMFSTYDRYDQQRFLRQRVPSDQRIDAYLQYEARCRAAGTRLWVSLVGVFEFLRTVEMAELKILWAKLDPEAAAGDFTDFQPKTVRRRPRYRDVQDRVLTYAQQVEKRFRLFGGPSALPERLAVFSAAWLGSACDPGDASLTADARANGILNILSDDQDFASLDGITLYTANQTVIDTAKGLNRLVTGKARR